MGSPDTAVQKFTGNGTFVTSWGSTGISDGQFISPSGVGVDSKGDVYVGDFGYNARVQKYDSNGNYITKWGSASVQAWYLLWTSDISNSHGSISHSG